MASILRLVLLLLCTVHLPHTRLLTQEMTLTALRNLPPSTAPGPKCKPCSRCRRQAEPLFDPSSSSTYSPFSCSSATCAQLHKNGPGPGNACSGSQCQYIVNYFDGSNTTGTYSSDTLTLSSNAVKNFQFGCSQSNSGVLLNLKTAGLIGLCRGAQSLVSQTAGTFGKAFSYCLPSNTGSGTGFLKLGAATSGFIKTTPILTLSTFPAAYAVRLQAIRVAGNKQLNIPTSLFSAGSVMDSGTTMTQLPPTAYKALSLAFKAAMKQYPLGPTNPKTRLTTCFNASGQSIVPAPVALVFSGGVVVDIAPEGILYGDCLAFAPNIDKSDSSFSIIGNMQQQTFEVLYNVGRRVVGFKAGAC